MHATYLACLFGGLVATLLFAALGVLGGAFHGGLHAFGGHAHALPGSGHAAPAHSHGQTALPARPLGHGPLVAGWLRVAFGWTLSWLSPLTLAAAALWFGSAGLLATSVLPTSLEVLGFAVALVAGVAGAALLRGLMIALVRSSTPPLHETADGALGTLGAAIGTDTVGEVAYTLEGLRRSAPARSVDGRPLPRGLDVVIVRRERGIAWVAPLDPLAALPPETARSAGGDLSPP